LRDHLLHQRLIAAQHQLGERVADYFAFGETKVGGECGVDVANKVIRVPGAEQGQRHAAVVQRGARQGAVGEQLEECRRGERLRGPG